MDEICMKSDREKLIELLRKTRYEYRRYIGMKDMEKRMAKTDEEFLAIDDSIVGEIPFCADHLIANGVTVQQWIPVYKKLPKKGQPVLIRSAVGADSIGEYRGRGIWFDLVFRADNVTHGHGGYEYGITHWADPTQPPKGE